jgi:hypothetical protein
LQAACFDHRADVVDHPHRHVCIGFRHGFSRPGCSCTPHKSLHAGFTAPCATFVVRANKSAAGFSSTGVF